MSKIRKCIICDSSYEYCPKCRQYASMPRWYSNFCCEECKTIYMTASDFAFGHIEAEEAKKKIQKMNVSKVKNSEISDIIKTFSTTSKSVKNDK